MFYSEKVLLLEKLLFISTTSATASPTTGTRACARQQQAIRDRGIFCVFSATTKNHGFTLGTDGFLRRSPYLITRMESYYEQCNRPTRTRT